jgi:hypothetical protein
MSCQRNEPALREHAHGAPLSPELEAHLASCTVCQQVMASEQRLLAEIDYALGAVGRVQPSPIFLAQARATALHRPRRTWLVGRLPAMTRLPIWALSAAAAALVIAALVARTRPSSVEPTPALVSATGVPSASSTPPLAATHPPALATASPSSNPSSSAPPLSRVPLPPPTSRETSAATRRSLARPPSSEPSILVPPGQADALVRLAVLINAGSVAPPVLLLEPPDPVQELRPPAELQIRPLAIEPIMSEGADNEGDTL